MFFQRCGFETHWPVKCPVACTNVRCRRKKEKSDSDRVELQRKLNNEMKTQVNELIRSSSSWRPASEAFEMSSKATIAIGSIVSYAAATDVSGAYGKKLAFVGGSMSAIGATMINLSVFCQRQSRERSESLEKLCKKLGLEYEDVNQNFTVSK